MRYTTRMIFSQENSNSKTIYISKRFDKIAKETLSCVEELADKLFNFGPIP